MDAHAPEAAATLDDVRRVDAWARRHAAELAPRVRIREAMTTLLAFLFVLGVLVFIHELGHFLLAAGTACG